MYPNLHLTIKLFLNSLNPPDIQECLQMPPVCNATQICEDTPPGSFTCSCPPGTVMNADGTCVGMHHIYTTCNNIHNTYYKCYMYESLI